MMANTKIRLLLAVLLGALLVGGCNSAKKRAARSKAEGYALTMSEKERAKGKKKRRATESRSYAERAEVRTPEPPQTSFQAKMPGSRIAQVSVPGPYVALTFDDGPSAAYTPHVLDILRRHNAKATFFVLGENAVRNKDILARAAAEGHEIGSHTWSHVKLTSTAIPRVHSEMERTNSVIREATGRYPAIMRPPYGATNPNLVDMMVQVYGMPSILWDVDTEDWKHPGVGVVVRRAVKNAKNGSIILLHDIHASTLAAVEDVVKGLQARGFTLVTVSELIEMGRRAAQGERPRERQNRPAQAPSRGIWLTPVAADEGGDAGGSGNSLPPAPEEPVAPANPAAAPQATPAVAADMPLNVPAETGRTAISES